MLIYEEGEPINNDLDYDTEFGEYSSISIRYPISDLMQLEIGSSIHSTNERGNLSNATYELAHQYSRAHIGVTFILK